MTPQEIERDIQREIELEVQARVDFKMSEFKTALANLVKLKYGIAFCNPNGHNVRMWEAYRDIQTMISKEINMDPPYNEMDKLRQRKARNWAVDEIERSLKIRGQRDGYHKLSIINSIIEKAQNY
jgi:hypothetical protein